MARPLRIEVPGGYYDITARGARRNDIFEDDIDRVEFLAGLAAVVEHCRWQCEGYCLMSNHYHLLIRTPEIKGTEYLKLISAE